MAIKGNDYKLFCLVKTVKNTLFYKFVDIVLPDGETHSIKVSRFGFKKKLSHSLKLIFKSVYGQETFSIVKYYTLRKNNDCVFGNYINESGTLDAFKDFSSDVGVVRFNSSSLFRDDVNLLDDSVFYRDYKSSDQNIVYGRASFVDEDALESDLIRVIGKKPGCVMSDTHDICSVFEQMAADGMMENLGASLKGVIGKEDAVSMLAEDDVEGRIRRACIELDKHDSSRLEVVDQYKFDKTARDAIEKMRNDLKDSFKNKQAGSEYSDHISGKSSDHDGNDFYIGGTVRTENLTGDNTGQVSAKCKKYLPEEIITSIAETSNCIPIEEQSLSEEIPKEVPAPPLVIIGDASSKSHDVMDVNPRSESRDQTTNDASSGSSYESGGSYD